MTKAYIRIRIKTRSDLYVSLKMSGKDRCEDLTREIDLVC